MGCYYFSLMYSLIFHVEFPVGRREYIPRYWDMNSLFDLGVVKRISCSAVLNILKKSNHKPTNLRYETLNYTVMYEILLYIHVCVFMFITTSLKCFALVTFYTVVGPKHACQSPYSIV